MTATSQRNNQKSETFYGRFRTFLRELSLFDGFRDIYSKAMSKTAKVFLKINEDDQPKNELAIVLLCVKK